MITPAIHLTIYGKYLMTGSPIHGAAAEESFMPEHTLERITGTVMTHVRRASLFAAMFLLGASAADAGPLYVLSGAHSGYEGAVSFGSIDVATGAYTEITAAIDGGSVKNLAWNPAIEAFYVIQGNEPALLRTLATNGTLSGGVSLGTFLVYGMAYRQTDDLLYIYSQEDTDYGIIVPSTGAWTNYGESGVGGVDPPWGGRFAIHNGTLYMAENLRQGVDPSVGRFGSIGFESTSEFQQIGSLDPVFQQMVLASDGTSLYGLLGSGTEGQQALYTIDPTTGTPTFLRSVSGSGLGVNFYGAGFVPAVPEPSTCVMALAGIVCGGFSMWRRRKRA